MLKLKLQYFGHLMKWADSLEKTLMLGGIGGRRRGWDGWMASLTRWAWVWVNSRSWWWTGRPGVLRFMGLQRVRHDWATELNWTCLQNQEFSQPSSPGLRIFLNNSNLSGLFTVTSLLVLPRWLGGKESADQCRRGKRCRFSPWVGRIPRSRKWQPTLVFLPGRFHGQRSLSGCSPWGKKDLDTTEWLKTSLS